MRFVLYNMRYAAGGGRYSVYLRRTDRNLDAIAGFLAGLNPDIVGLVEVDAGSYRTRRCHQAQALAERLGHYHSYRSKYGVSCWPQFMPIISKQGNAFLTRDTIANEQFHYFERGMKRMVIELELADITVFLVHLSLGAKVRQSQMAELYALVKNTTKPHIIAGDFNAFWGEPEISLFLAATGLRNANIERVATYPSWAPRRHLDFVLYSAGLSLTRFSVPQVRHSDHLPIVCDFEIETLS